MERTQEAVMLNKRYFWDRLIEYYYDHVHWEQENPPSVYEWVKQEFGGDVARYHEYISFEDPAQASYFALKWT